MNLRPLLFFAAGMAVMVGLFFAMKPDFPTANQTSVPANAARSVDRRFSMRIAKRALVSGPAVIRVKQDEWVVLGFLSDEAGHVHLHGYNLMLPLQTGKPSFLKFQAKRTGRFEYELEEAGVEIGALEVEPR